MRWLVACSQHQLPEYRPLSRRAATSGDGRKLAAVPEVLSQSCTVPDLACIRNRRSIQRGSFRAAQTQVVVTLNDGLQTRPWSVT